MIQAREALRRKTIEAAQTNKTSAPIPETNAPALTRKLITAPPNAADLPPPANPSEALRRKMDQLSAEEHQALRPPSPAAATNAPTVTNAPGYVVSSYSLPGIPPAAAEAMAARLQKHTGTNLALDKIIQAALEVQEDFRQQGHTAASVAFAPSQITNGIVKFNVFQAASPQIVVAGMRYFAPAPAKTNPPAKFAVQAYEVTGDTLLSDDTLRWIFGKYTGTNIGVAEILKAGSELQMEYRDRGYPTVNVTIPPQQITNGIVKIRVFEGELASVTVIKNRYFSANNVLRALPGLKTNQILVGPVFQGELDRANANQDRQIYPQLSPGPRENTSALTLEVKDRLPLHAKVEFNNQNSPGTPDMRINTSAAYDNLWQLEHTLGVQYSFSPQDYKNMDIWNFYDLPAVANYSAFYRLALGALQPVAGNRAAAPGGFGYDEATRRFQLPAASGRADLTVYASRSAIDTGLQTVFESQITTTSATNTSTLSRRDVQQDITVNNNIGARLTLPVPPRGNWQSAFSLGGDFKTYQASTYKTNTFTITDVYVDDSGLFHTNTDIIYSPVPSNGVTVKTLEYLPFSVRYDGSVRDPLGITSFGLGLSLNVWHSGSVTKVRDITGSSGSSGYWFIVTPSISRDFVFLTNWPITLRLDAQIASEPLISNEQYGAGGVNSVRGYHEGEVFGDDGWHIGLEQKTPASVIGLVGRKLPLVVRGSIFMDYAELYLLDPEGREGRTALWGVGAGAVMSIGSYWEAHLLFGVPLLAAGSIEAYHPRFNFALSGQF